MTLSPQRTGTRELIDRLAQIHAERQRLEDERRKLDVEEGQIIRDLQQQQRQQQAQHSSTTPVPASIPPPAALVSHNRQQTMPPPAHPGLGSPAPAARSLFLYPKRRNAFNPLIGEIDAVRKAQSSPSEKLAGQSTDSLYRSTYIIVRQQLEKLLRTGQLDINVCFRDHDPAVIKKHELEIAKRVMQEVHLDLIDHIKIIHRIAANIFKSKAHTQRLRNNRKNDKKTAERGPKLKLADRRTELVVVDVDSDNSADEADVLYTPSLTLRG
ncbi:hypothetical protein BC940DRAFT_302512 [Gongronella butleri]|nr:hypothetical protein BC940DRAFT_302512 [Gongronella butleri]